jgi:hypothetical protein
MGVPSLHGEGAQYVVASADAGTASARVVRTAESRLFRFMSTTFVQA